MRAPSTPDETTSTKPDMRSRRHVLLAGTVAAGALALSGAARAEGEHDHHKMQGAAAPDAPKQPRRALVDAAVDCIRHGEICAAHCVDMLARGDTSLKDCYRTVTAMLPLCKALAQYAAADAARLRDLAKLCIDVCDDCAKECKKHAEHHAMCRRCLDSCEQCIKDCKAIL